MSNIKKRNLPLFLLILDGWGIWKEKKGNAIALAKTPVINGLYKKYPHTLLQASAKFVGLPSGQPGNSEAGHMNIGAGRVVEQDAVIISKSINNGTFFKNPAFLQAARHASDNNSNIHLMGLLSDGSSPHSDIDHLLSLITFFTSRTKQKIYLHLFTDGRDSPPFAALKILSQYKSVFNSNRVSVATIMGRFYAMDRKKSWARTKQAFGALVMGKGYLIKSATEAVERAYNRGESDEFIKPSVVVHKNKKPVGAVQSNDTMVFFNLRSDRARQLTKVFAQNDFTKKNKGAFSLGRKITNLLFVALTDFGPDLEGVLTAYPGMDVSDTLPIALRGLRQCYIAETEKYAHVTYFLNGGYDHPVANEDWVNIPSKDVDSYADQPEMSTNELTKRVLGDLKDNPYDFVLMNFAAPDMVGHTGNLKAGIKAVEIVDKAVGQIIEAVLAKKGTIIITADHGNIEEMINLSTDEIDTEHSINPVPFIVINHRSYKLKKNGKLSNIAPTILDIFGIQKPKLMNEKSLIVK
ncbi:MAG: phosphoglycerate mutase (2,3-diphosphoglycerate-independent) [Candidatus Komeilibacteria bacterium RIFOXYC1_FULL_37_11]|uniref:2,3-bisphosphoglycerate-independent phosphoglycerate mutase n=1 Tax=Candidatus Komeilibacteria bacterium RIFOXYC1_FULL_37_11 TaxID=1798555 RepID=A0A1G2BXA6_9BACT|nr:MAG: phosphoglycerate mutase (2,3-diphosphoglycerate-independent) [Candidatus Komeilibacteria bacterium RIFOXYC1_FULL_37_11]OGY95838.1 MAG: phosphoglycerate mutase (2,3-diphosphoglycerate-independent) [Candidatus Komeilibacteria bacterium RIFOXYD1_FULL_37_29]